MASGWGSTWLVSISSYGCCWSYQVPLHQHIMTNHLCTFFDLVSFNCCTRKKWQSMHAQCTRSQSAHFKQVDSVCTPFFHYFEWGFDNSMAKTFKYINAFDVNEGDCYCQATQHNGHYCLHQSLHAWDAHILQAYSLSLCSSKGCNLVPHQIKWPLQI